MTNENSSNNGNKILIVIAMVMGVVIGLMFGSHQTGKNMSDYTSLQGKMSEVLDLVERQYVDSIDADSLSERLVSVMLNDLDPHSTYLTARETERTAEMMRGNFEGVGLVIRREGDTSFVGQVLDDGPSANSGILPGVKSREDLKNVPGLGPKAFEQCAGFLKIAESSDPLDNTWVHPENYDAAREVLPYIQNKEKVPADLIKKLAEKYNIGETTVKAANSWQ